MVRGTFLAWSLHDRRRPPEEAILDGVERYRGRFGRTPSLILIPQGLKLKRLKGLKAEVRTSPHLPSHLVLLGEREEDETAA